VYYAQRVEHDPPRIENVEIKQKRFSINED